MEYMKSEWKGRKCFCGAEKWMVDVCCFRRCCREDKVLGCWGKSKVYPCEVGCLGVKANSVLSVQCGRWIHGRCARVKRVTQKFSRNLTCRKCERNIGEAVERKKKFCEEVETAMEFTYLGDRVSADGGCEAAVPARTRCEWV